MTNARAHTERRAPDRAWQDLVRTIVDECRETLWSEAGRPARRFLVEKGFSEETLRRTHLGFCAADTEYRGLHVDRGITIPWFVAQDLWQVNVRTDQRQKPRYRPIEGSRPALYGINSLRGKQECIVSSNELEAMLLWQELGNSLGTVSAGSTFSGHLDDRWLPALLGIDRFWIVTGTGLRGRKAAEQWLSSVGERGRLIELPGNAETVSDAVKAGFDLCDWLQSYRTSLESATKLSAAPEFTDKLQPKPDQSQQATNQETPSTRVAEYPAVAHAAGFTSQDADWEDRVADIAAIARECQAQTNS